MKYSITDKSKEDAKRKYAEIYYSPGHPNNAVTAFASALDTLLIPQNEKECIFMYASPVCTSCLDKKQKEESPISLRFRMPNGDKVEILKDDEGWCFFLNTSKNLLIKIKGAFCRKSNLAAQQALEEIGAIQEDNFKV